MSTTSAKILSTVLGCTLLLAGTEHVHAEEAATPTYSFDEYVITASRIPQKKTQTAANVTVISQAEIEQGHFSSVPDILRHNNVTIQSNSASSVPVLNGDDRVLVLVDGRRMNWESLVVSGNSHAGLNLDMLPVGNIERIEIVRGPGSSLYGSDAVGGVINIITRKPESARTTVATEFGSWGSQRYAFSTEGQANGLSYAITAEKKKRSSYDYKDGATGQTKKLTDSQISQEAVTLRLDKELTSDSSLTLQLEHHNDDSGFAGLENSPYFRYHGGTMESDSNNLALSYHWGKEQGKDNFIRVYNNTLSGSNHNSLVKSDGTPYTYDLKASGIDWQQAWDLSPTHTLIGGADWRQESLDDQDTIDRSYTSKALFMENIWKLPKNWSFSFGTRYDMNSMLGNHTTSRVTLNREINADTNIYASWGQYVKNPTMQELFSNTMYWHGNAALKPETGSTLTLGANTKLDEATTLQASIFQSKVNDALYWQSASGGTTWGQYINLSHEKRRGFDINVTRKLSESWNVAAGYSYVHRENQADANSAYTLDLTNSQPNAYHVTFNYAKDKWDGSLALRAGTGRSTAAYTASSYLTADMVVNYKINPDTRVYLKALNLTNEGYELSTWGTVGGYPMPARSFYVGVERRL